MDSKAINEAIRAQLGRNRDGAQQQALAPGEPTPAMLERTRELVEQLGCDVRTALDLLVTAHQGHLHKSGPGGQPEPAGDGFDMNAAIRTAAGRNQVTLGPGESMNDALRRAGKGENEKA